jgi:hypothetical protein
VRAVRTADDEIGTLRELEDRAFVGARIHREVDRHRLGSVRRSRGEEASLIMITIHDDDRLRSSQNKSHSAAV